MYWHFTLTPNTTTCKAVVQPMHVLVSPSHLRPTGMNPALPPPPHGTFPQPLHGASNASPSRDTVHTLWVFLVLARCEWSHMLSAHSSVYSSVCCPLDCSVLCYPVLTLPVSAPMHCALQKARW
eukprot:scpid83436/ scgid13358/ 